jgi:signal transduction histidine kinase
MKRPWQIWSIFMIALLLTAAAVGWLSLRALESDRAEVEGRAQAAIEENVRLALWRIDSLMTSFVAQESARPYADYQAVTLNQGPAGPGMARQSLVSATSPLLAGPSPDVLGNFQLDSAGKLASPQAPAPAVRGLVVPRVISAEQLERNERRLAELGKLLDYQTLLAQLPAPAENSGESVILANSNTVTMAPLEQNSRGPGAQAARGANEFQNRSQFLVQNNGIAARNNVPGPAASSTKELVRLASMRPVVLHHELVLARQAIVGGDVQIQGCWLDWSSIRTQLLSTIADLLPHAKLELVESGAENGQARMMAALPVRLDPGPRAALEITGSETTALSPVRLSLLMAWGAMALAAVAIAVLMRGVVVLSERRADFVSAVTHELRTPLTTFRMYAEMLAEGMVPDEATRRKYLDTLLVEADRLTHLVENVLAYARLEQGGLGNRVRAVRGGELIGMCTSRANDRARQAGLEMHIGADAAVENATALADPSAVEQIVFNLVDNACKYAKAATNRELLVKAEIADQELLIHVRDHGPGIAARQRQSLFQPFHKSAGEAAATAPGVGLGLALSRRLARDMGGDLRLDDRISDGAGFVIVLPLAARCA